MQRVPGPRKFGRHATAGRENQLTVERCDIDEPVQKKKVGSAMCFKMQAQNSRIGRPNRADSLSREEGHEDRDRLVYKTITSVRNRER
jgi:hypothetical protein